MDGLHRRYAQVQAESALAGVSDLLMPHVTTSCEKAWRCSAASPAPPARCWGPLLKTRAVARIPMPSAGHASTRTISSTDTRLP